MKTPKWSQLGPVFTDETAARQLLERMRWPNGPICPHCGEANPYKLNPKPGSSTRQGVYKCRVKGCRRQFTVTVGTVFESSHIPVTKWIQAIYLQCASKKGISALQLKRMLDFGSYKSAWFMAHRLRHAMTMEPFASKLGGTNKIVEADETYIGGKRRLKFGTKSWHANRDHKTAVVALVERGGRVRAMPMERVTIDTLGAALNEHVDTRSQIYTDENMAYKKATKGFRAHRFVSHSQDEYVRGGVHSNTAEGFFSLLKRGLHGTYHHCGKGHLAKYCDEFAFKYSTRKVTDAERVEMLVQGAEGKRLMYEQPDPAV